MSHNPPRAYDLSLPIEVARLIREVRGYLHTCHFKHGTDWEGRKFAIEALDRIIDGKAAGIAIVNGERGLRDRLLEERNTLENSFGHGAFQDGLVRERIRAIDQTLASGAG